MQGLEESHGTFCPACPDTVCTAPFLDDNLEIGVESPKPGVKTLKPTNLPECRPQGRAPPGHDLGPWVQAAATVVRHTRQGLRRPAGSAGVAAQGASRHRMMGRYFGGGRFSRPQERAPGRTSGLQATGPNTRPHERTLRPRERQAARADSQATGMNVRPQERRLRPQERAPGHTNARDSGHKGVRGWVQAGLGRIGAEADRRAPAPGERSDALPSCMACWTSKNVPVLHAHHRSAPPCWMLPAAECAGRTPHMPGRPLSSLLPQRLPDPPLPSPTNARHTTPALHLPFTTQRQPDHLFKSVTQKEAEAHLRERERLLSLERLREARRRLLRSGRSSIGSIQMQRQKQVW